MKYIEITVKTTQIAQELIADILWDYSPLGVAVCDSQDVKELIEKRADTFDYIDENLVKDSVTLVKGYVETQEQANEVEKRLQELKLRSVFPIGSVETAKRIVDGDDWIEIWRKHYKPFKIGEITVCPEWIECKADGVKVLIGTDSAFGTGEHETTSMCVEFIQKYIEQNMVVADVGTGSGILGIVCAKLGAKSVFMTDIDEIAVASAKHNVNINGVSNVCEVVKADLLDKAQGKCDLIVANITADILAILVENIKTYLSDKAVVILSGIINDKVEYVERVYTDKGFYLIEKKRKGEWNALVMGYNK